MDEQVQFLRRVFLCVLTTPILMVYALSPNAPWDFHKTAVVTVLLSGTLYFAKTAWDSWRKLRTTQSQSESPDSD